MLTIFRRIGRLSAFATLILVSGIGCGSDSPTNTDGGGGGGGGNNNLVIPAGNYSVVVKFWTCGDTDTVTQNEDFLQCSGQEIDELFEGDPINLPCPLKVTGDSIWMDCTITVEQPEFSGCMVTWHATASGVRTSDTWVVTGEVNEISDVPTDCNTLACVGFSIDLVRNTSSVPTACQYADENTVEGTVGGGPHAGKQTLDANGSSYSDPSGIGFSFEAGYFDGSTTVTAPVVDGQRSTGFSNGVRLYMDIPPIDPKTLPVTLPVTGDQKVSRSGGGPVVTVYYNDGRLIPLQYFYSAAATGTVTIRELSDGHAAGTFNVNFSGQQCDQGGCQSSTRTFNGGFFVSSEDQF